MYDTHNKNITILFASGRPTYPFFIGGDGISMHNLLSGLVKRGFGCMALGCFDLPNRNISNTILSKYLDNKAIIPSYSLLVDNTIIYNIEYPCILVSYDSFSLKLKEMLTECYSIKIIITQLEMSSYIIELANYLGIPVVLFVIDNTKPNIATFSHLRTHNFVIFNSEFTKNDLKKYLPRDFSNYRVIPPLINFDTIKSLNKIVSNRRYITIINPRKQKGGKIALEIVKRLKHREFLIVELFDSLKDQGFDFTVLPNVVMIKRELDMRKIYAQTQVLLVPSKWDECFGMVAVEAQINGIPPIVSDRGALPEVIGHGGVVVNHPDDVDQWIWNIEKILTNNNEYNYLSQKALINAGRFDYNQVTEQYLQFFINL
jgi:glycosyltransferase involved in cell wall biosynthesis